MRQKITSKSRNGQLDSLVLLRAIAVIMVCLCHFSSAFPSTPFSSTSLTPKVFNFFVLYGKFGVQIFFVISGFIIPFSLYRGKYRIQSYFTFLLKRILRLHPSYLAALFATLVIMHFTYEARHVIFPEDLNTISQSLVYFHFPSDNPVFWTLGIEAQYYLLIGLLYPMLMNYTRIFYFVLIPIILWLSHTSFGTHITLASHFVFFLLGNIVHMIYSDTGDRRLNIAAILSLLLYTYYFYEMAAFISSLSTIIFILYYQIPVPNIAKFIGTISYSIYLIHFPLGIKFINFLRPKISPLYSWPIFIAAFIITIIASWIFYKIFEEFSDKLSKRIKYRSAFSLNLESNSSTKTLITASK